MVKKTIELLVESTSSNIELIKGISKFEASEDYILLTDNLHTVYEIIHKISTIQIPFEGYGHIPLEIAIGTVEYRKELNSSPQNRGEVISELKNDIISPFRQDLKFKSRKKTFVLATHDFWNELDNADKQQFDVFSSNQIYFTTPTFFEKKIRH